MMRTSIYITLAALTGTLFAASTKTWEMNTHDDFLAGKFEGVSLGRDGRLSLAPELKTVFSSGQPAVWSVVRTSDGVIYLGTGHGGQVFQVEESGDSKVIWTADEPEVFALALDPKGILYAATSPNGKVYRIENGEASEYFDPGATYIWSLAFGENGSLFVGTGDEGKIYRVSKDGKGEVYYETGQVHVTCLEFDGSGHLLAGTEPNGILYRVSAKDRAFVLFDADLPEIRAMAPQPDGNIYVAALGGSVSKRAATALLAPTKSQRVTAAPTSITVAAAQGGVEIQPQSGQQKQPATASTPVATALPMIEVSGVEKSALFRVHPDNTVDKLWSSTEENAYDLYREGDNLVFSTDKQGRLYELSGEDNVRMLAQTNESEAVRLLPSGRELLVATGNMGKIFRVGSGAGESGVYEAPVHDAARVARWGQLCWQPESGAGGKVTFETRSGNSARPDKTWSDWSAPLTTPSGSAITSPNARFIQWRAKLAAAKGESPVVDSVTLAYLPQNAPPKIAGITVTSQTSPSNSQSGTASSATSATAAYSITVTDTGEAGASTVSGTSTQKLTNSISDQVQVTWQTEDLDGDKLIYAVYFRGDGEREWKLLEDRLEDTTYKIDSDVLADGRYFFRVEASDSPANPPETARTASKVSAPILIDHTPPVVSLKMPKRDGKVVELEFEAQDTSSALQRCEYSLDAGPWVPVSPREGIIDSRREEFRLRLDKVSTSEHLLVVRVYDSSDNAGLAKVILR